MQHVRAWLSIQCAAPLISPAKQKCSRARTDFRAFTLIEVAISLAIFSFAIVGMMGMMALGLTTSRKSMDFNTETAISQQLSGEAEVLNYSMITNAASSYRVNFQNNRYFDVFGAELTNSPVPASYAYVAALTVTNAYLPGTNGGSPVAQELIFQITTPHLPGTTNSYYLWEVDNGR